MTITIEGQQFELVGLYKNLRTGALQDAPSIYGLPQELLGYLLKPATPHPQSNTKQETE